MDQSLRDAAEHGSIDALYALIQSDANVLDMINNIPFVDTPLHIAASAGHIGFAMEVMKLKPSFAKKLNKDGFSPMHLALQKLHELENKVPDLQRNETQLSIQKNKENQTQLVDRLLDVDSNLVRVQGRDNVTPLHYVAQIGNLSFLAKFFKACPKSLEDVTIRKENAMHIALKYDMVKAFGRLLGLVVRAWFKDAKLLEEKLLYSQDEEGNTLSHIAVNRNHREVVSWLLDRGLFDLKTKNLEGKTAFDGNQNRARGASILKYYFALGEKLYVRIRRQQRVLTDDRRNALLVVAALLLTVTFQAGLDPPGEVRKASKDQFDRLLHKSKNILNGNTFLLFNTITYYLTTVTIFFLLPPDFIGFVLYLLLLVLYLCYSFSPPVFNSTVTRVANSLFFASFTVFPFTILYATWVFNMLSSNKEDVSVDPAFTSDRSVAA